jgi:hypothetical protein
MLMIRLKSFRLKKHILNYVHLSTKPFGQYISIIIICGTVKVNISWCMKGKILKHIYNFIVCKEINKIPHLTPTSATFIWWVCTVKIIISVLSGTDLHKMGLFFACDYQFFLLKPLDWLGSVHFSNSCPFFCN